MGNTWIKAIFSQPAKANQSRAEGTGGSTIQFLKRFFDDTVAPAMKWAEELEAEENLSSDDHKKVLAMKYDLLDHMEEMTAVDAKRVGSWHVKKAKDIWLIYLQSDLTKQEM